MRGILTRENLLVFYYTFFVVNFTLTLLKFYLNVSIYDVFRTTFCRFLANYETRVDIR